MYRTPAPKWSQFSTAGVRVVKKKSVTRYKNKICPVCMSSAWSAWSGVCVLCTCTQYQIQTAHFTVCTLAFRLLEFSCDTLGGASPSGLDSLASAGVAHSQGVGYSGPPTPLKGLLMSENAEKAKGSIPGGLGLEGLFLRNHRKSARAVPTPRHCKPPRCGG